MIRLIKISAYVLFALLLPLWLYVMTQENIKKEDKPKSDQSQSLNVIVNGSHLDTLFATYGKTFQNKNDSIVNFEVNRNINRLTNISIANAQALQELLSTDRSISFDKITVDVNPSKNDSSAASKTPTYLIYDTLRFPTFRVPYQYFENLILSNNLDRTVYLYKNQRGERTDGLDSVFFLSDTVYNKILAVGPPSFDTINISSGMDFILNNSTYFKRNFSKPFYIIGYYYQQAGVINNRKYFRIPVLIERTNLR